MKRLSYKNFDRSSQEDWDKFIGNNFTILLNKIKAPKNSTIIEVAPGNSAAIGYSLSNFNFSGTLYIIEPNMFFSNKIKSVYRKLLPNANIIIVNKLLSELKKKQYFKNKKIDLTISHHPLDDFIIGKSFLNLNNLNNFFTKYHTAVNIDNATMLAKRWNKALTDYKFIQQAMKDTFEEWSYIINISNSLIMSACDSYFYKKYSSLFPILKYPDYLAKLILKQLKLHLNKKSLIRINKNSIFQSPSYWLCMKKR